MCLCMCICMNIHIICDTMGLSFVVASFIFWALLNRSVSVFGAESVGLLVLGFRGRG